MGIKNLMKLIKKYASGCIEPTRLYRYRNKTLGIDANLMIYKNIYAIRKKTKDLYNQDKIITHIHILLLQIIKFLEYNITPVFVFDGVPPDLKQDVLKYREYLLEKYKDNKKYYFMYAGISYREILEIKNIIRAFGYSIIDAPQEADAQLAHMSMNKQIDYIVSDDLDILVFGGLNILKNFTVNEKKNMSEINLDILLRELKINHDQLIDICILTGSDYLYNQKIKNIGPIKSYKLISKHKKVENLELDTRELDYQSIRFYFRNPIVLKHPVIDHKGINIEYVNRLLDDYKYDRDSYIRKKIDFLTLRDLTP